MKGRFWRSEIRCGYKALLCREASGSHLCPCCQREPCHHRAGWIAVSIDLDTLLKSWLEVPPQLALGWREQCSCRSTLSYTKL